jgi:predicted alpha/beta-hydrolase family hydrolase
MTTHFLFTGAATAPATVLLAHGAGAAMDSASMTAMAEAIADEGLRVARFEFGYMASRRVSDSRRPPPRADTLIPEYEEAVADLASDGPLLIGGKSMGGRVASMAADDLFMAGKIAGLVCLGYPFHPPGRPVQLRTAHLEKLETPALICQGSRDPFGSRDELAGLRLPATVELMWLEDGDHDLRPRKSVSGFSSAGHLKNMAAAVRRFADRVAR